MAQAPSLQVESPIRSIFCLKNMTDMHTFDEVEDCFILDFDPFDTIDFSKISVSQKSNLSHDQEVTILAEKGQVACRDYPHPRHLCLKFRFEETAHQSYCKMCYCFVCDKAAPCKKWNDGIWRHCDATGDFIWRRRRDQEKQFVRNLNCNQLLAGNT
ncbi:hypothetical protein Ancab_010098 [Ancistrocladus abbreviatus]